MNETTLEKKGIFFFFCVCVCDVLGFVDFVMLFGIVLISKFLGSSRMF
jgi:hypothetical protein